MKYLILLKILAEGYKFMFTIQVFGLDLVIPLSSVDLHKNNKLHCHCCALLSISCLVKCVLMKVLVSLLCDCCSIVVASVR